MAYQCELVDQPARPTLTVRTRAAVERLPQVLGPAWGAVMACARKEGAVPVDAPFVAYHTMDMRDLDLEIGFVFERPLADEGDVHALVPYHPGLSDLQLALTDALVAGPVERDWRVARTTTSASAPL